MMEKTNLKDYALMSSGTLNILLPQTDISSVEHIENRYVAESETIASASALAQSIETGARGFVSLSESLSLLPHIPNNTFVQTTWTAAPMVHWCWREVRWLNQVELAPQSIPEILKTPELPATAIVTLTDQTIAFIFDSQALLNYITQQGGL